MTLNLGLSLLIVFGSLTQRYESRSQVPVIDFCREFVSAVEASKNDFFEDAALAANVPVEYLKGMAFAESRFDAYAVGDQGRSKGMFQINETYREERIAQFGEYDPFNKEQAALVAAKILRQNYERLGTWENAIAAYKQGISGVLCYGRIEWHVEQVMNWEDLYEEETFDKIKSLLFTLRNLIK